DGWALTLLDLGRFPEAEAAFRESAEIRAEVQGENAVDVASSLTGLAESLTRQNKGKGAVEAARRALELREKGLAKTHWMIASTRSILGAALTCSGEFDEAEKQLLSAYNAMKDDPGAAKRRLPDTVDRLVLLYERSAKPDQAEQWRQRRISKQPPQP